jgi:hypothetical protein
MNRRSVVLVVLMVLALAGQVQAQDAGERWYAVTTYSRDYIVTTTTWFRPDQLDATIAALQRLRNGTAVHGYYDFAELDHEGYMYATRITCVGNVCDYAPEE